VFDILLLYYVVSTSASDCLERLIPEMTYSVLRGM